MNKKGFSFGEIFSILFILILIIGFIVFLCFAIFGLHIITTESGSHTGYVTAIETNGLIFKTDSVYFKTNAESTQEDRYCILNQTLKSKLEQYQKERKLVTIKFYTWMFYGWKYCKMDDTAIISDVILEEEN